MGRFLLVATALLLGRAVAQDLEFAGGGRLREQFEHFHNREFGQLRPRSDSYLLHRLQLRGEVSIGTQWRGLVELVSAFSLGQQTPKIPLDENRFDFLRAQVDWTPDVPAFGEARVRVGRQELLLGRGRLVSTREGPNVRLAFDGIRGTFGGGEQVGFTLDAFALAPVDQQLGTFDDALEADEKFYGAVLSVPLDRDEQLGADLYWLGRDREASPLAAGDEFRHTIGGRLAGGAGGFDLDVELMGQFGSIGAHSIRAFAISVIVERELDLLWRCRPGIRLDWISGDRDPTDARTQTFDALYPNNSYFNEAAALAPSNLRSVTPTLGLRPHDDVTVDLMWDFAWRDQVRDAVYVPPSVPGFPGATNRERFVGHSISAAVDWQCAEDLSLTMAWTHFEAGGAVSGAGGRDLDYFAMWVNYWF